MVQEGKKAPAFNLPSSEGGKLGLKDLAGKTVVLYFYPKDDTPGCTREAQGFQEALTRLKRKGATVVGVSRDSLESHDRFKKKYGLKFPLLSDPDAKVHQKYGAWGEKNMYGKKKVGPIRTTVVIGPDQKVTQVFPKVRVDGHVDKVLEAVDEAKGGAKTAAKKATGAAKKTAKKAAGAAKKTAEKTATKAKTAAKKAKKAKAGAKKAKAGAGKRR